MTILAFLLTALVLTLEGFLVAQLVLGKNERLLAALLGYPLGALINAFAFFVVHLISVPLNGIGVWVGHGVVLVVLFFSSFFVYATKKEAKKTHRAPGLLRPALGLLSGSYRVSEPARRHATSDASDVAGPSSAPPVARGPLLARNLCGFIILSCLAMLAIIALSSIAYATLLPSYYWDAFTNWAMRTKVSFVAGEFVNEGVAQPQYPILPHALYMVYMIAMGWNDWLVGPSTILLSLSAFAALFVLLKRRSGTLVALVALTLTLSMPLAVVHLRQGFFDIHLAAYALLSAVLLKEGLHGSKRRLVILSAILCGAAAWTKWEGFYFGVIPWMVVVVVRTNFVYSFIRLFVYSGGRKRFFRINESTNQRINGFNPTLSFLLLLLLILPWPLYVLSQGLPLSPHGGSFALNVSALPLALRHMFLMGTFGLHWYAIVLLVALLAIAQPRRLLSPPILWGLIATTLILLIYLFTEETRGLEHGDNFARALLMPVMLLTVGLSAAIAELVRRGADGDPQTFSHSQECENVLCP